MPSFDFSNALPAAWENSIPGGAVDLYLQNASWKGTEFEIIADKFVDASTNSGNNMRRYRVHCVPLFALVVHHEAMSLNLWNRISELKIKGQGHYIIRNSDWINSMKTHEKYGYDWHEGEATHYVFTTDPQVVHIISKTEPEIEILGEWRGDDAPVTGRPLPGGPIAISKKKVAS